MRNHELSQHFLRSPRLALTLIGHSDIKKRDLVLDIGAGSGVISSALSRRCREVWAIEPDPATAAKLRANLARQGINNVRVLEQDFRSITLPSEPYKVFSNPPFHLSAEILYKLLNLQNLDGQILPQPTPVPRAPDSIHLILQKNLALKLIASERHYSSQLGNIINRSYVTKIRFPLKKTDFTPPPAVDTVLWQAKKLQAGVEESL